MSAGSYVGGKDVSRMRQAMIARKADITKRGGMKKALWKQPQIIIGWYNSKIRVASFFLINF